MYDVAVDVGQAETSALETVRAALVVNAEKMEHRREDGLYIATEMNGLVGYEVLAFSASSSRFANCSLSARF